MHTWASTATTNTHMYQALAAFQVRFNFIKYFMAKDNHSRMKIKDRSVKNALEIILWQWQSQKKMRMKLVAAYDNAK